MTSGTPLDRTKKRTKGTSVEFKIPPGTRRIVVKRYREVRGKGELRITLGRKGGVETTGYLAITTKKNQPFDAGKVSVRKRR